MAAAGFARWPAVAMAVVATLTIAFPMLCASTTHTVGGSNGWTIPPSSTFYPNWASQNKFAVGDTLVFNFATGAHTVVEVPKSSYDACSTKNQVGPTISTGPATVTVNTAGDHYYICSVTGHCNLNQKLAITVSGGSAATPSTPPPVGDASSPTPPPTAGGPSGSSTGGGSSAAAPASMVGIPAAAAAGILLAAALW